MTIIQLANNIEISRPLVEGKSKIAVRSLNFFKLETMSLEKSLALWSRHLEWGNLEAVVNGDGSIDINNVTNDAREHLEFHDRIVKVSLGWGHLIVTTPTQCFIYK